MIGSLAKDTPGEICREILEHENDVSGLVVFAFTPDGHLTWGMTGAMPAHGMIAAANILMAELRRANVLAAMPPEGRA